MKYILFYLTLLIHALPLSVNAQEIWNKYKSNVSATYSETILFFKELDKNYPQAKLMEYGKTDNGKPLHLFVISPEKIFDRDALRKMGYTVLLINNGIHPGEPDGINACIRLSKFILDGTEKLPAKVVLAIIPVYNIEGSEIKSNYFRAGQNGPEEVGFRGNYRNLDLNRDFIKCDSENAKSFTLLYQAWDPDVFIDTHVTDGADYQYVMTLIDSQKDKLHPIISKVMQQNILPTLYSEMEKSGQPMSPYVNVWGKSPEEGMEGFLEYPRFASGYSTLFNAFPFVTETHMLKPFPERVDVTYQFLKVALNTCSKYGSVIQKSRKEANEFIKNQQIFPLLWSIDSTQKDSLFFRGYSTTLSTSPVTGLDRLNFDRGRPYSKYIPYYNTFKTSLEITRPPAYLLPQAWKEVIERLKFNGIEMDRLKRDTVIEAAVYYIRDYTTVKKPYEGHYLHSDVKVDSDTQRIQCFAGDYVISCNQPANRYIIETLEPQAPDAFFAWNFFDEILQQKEWFSDYLFEDEAATILNQDPALKTEFEKKKSADPEFSRSSWAMLSWIFERSNWKEPSHLRYPVLRLLEPLQLDSNGIK